MEEGDRILLRLDREIYYFLETIHWTLWLASLPNTNYFKFGIIMLHQTLSWWWVVFRAENIAVPHKQMFRNELMCLYHKHQTAMIHKIQGKRNAREILKHLYGAALMVFCKAVLKHSMSIKTHTHTALKSTHILLTFQLPVHANLSISD